MPLTSPDAEKSVLGTLLMLGNCDLPPALEPQHFYWEKHGFLYGVIQGLHGKGRGFDVPCVERALVAMLPPNLAPEQVRARAKEWRAALDLLVAYGQVSMLTDHARLVVEAALFRGLKNRSLELQDAALRGDEVALGRALEAAHVLFGQLRGLGGRPALEVVKGEAA